MSALQPRGESFLRPRLEAALHRCGDTHDFADVVRRVMQNRAQWWSTPDERGVIVTEVMRFPKLSAINYWLVAGEYQACLSLVPEIEEFARRQDCSRAIALGRKGFGRLLGPDVRVTGTGYAKELVPREFVR